jgi:hypothetical protein
MKVVKGIVVGLLAGFLAAVLWLLGRMFVPLLWELSRSSSSSSEGPGGGLKLVEVWFDSRSVALAALVGFVAGFGLTLRRSRRRV